MVTAIDFRRGITTGAIDLMNELVGPEKGREAGARVAMAYRAAVQSAKDPAALRNCTRESVLNAVAQSAITNLMPGGAYPMCWLVPKGGELQWWISHRGIAALALRAGYHLMPTPVAVEDEVRIEFGEVVAHERDPEAWPDGVDDLIGVYVTIKRVSDRAVFARPWMPMQAIKKRQAMAQTQGVWNKWGVAQSQKTALKWVMARGYVPIEAELQMALAAEPRQEDRPATVAQLPPPADLGLDPVPVPVPVPVVEAEHERVVIDEAEPPTPDDRPTPDIDYDGMPS
jgi:recombinational DNA repair protein RecT